MEKLNLGIFPTPFYKLENMSAHLGVDIYIKRDDMSGVALGGNKVRKLEYLLYDAMKKGADTVLTTGGAQSNHAMLTAACARKLNMTPILVLKKRGVSEKLGNLLLEDMMGVDVRFVDADSYDEVYAQMQRISDELEASGRHPYSIPVGGSTPLGTLGYVDSARELFCQAEKLNVKLDRVVCTAGSGGTQAGLVLGARLYGNGARVTGIAVSDDPFENIVYELVQGANEILGHPAECCESDVEVHYYYGAGYAIPSHAGVAAMRLMAEKEGIILDPVYTGKAFAGLIELINRGIINKGERIAFVHTGGAGGLFAIDIDSPVD